MSTRERESARVLVVRTPSPNPHNHKEILFGWFPFYASHFCGGMQAHFPLVVTLAMNGFAGRPDGLDMIGHVST